MRIRVEAINEYKIGKKIGEGTFSIVYVVQKKNSKLGEKYAMKIIKDKYKSLDEVQKNEEIRVMNKIGHHNNIISLRDILFEPKQRQLALVMDLMEMNLLDLILPDMPPLSTENCLKLTYQLLKGLSYIHQLGFIHRDIKPENCLINKKTMELKLADFGSTRTPAINSTMTEYIATRWYRPPECLLTSGDYGMAIDMWAVGCVFYEMMTKKPLFPGKNAIDQIQKIHEVIGPPSESQLMRIRASDTTMKNIGFNDLVEKSESLEQTAQIELRHLLPNATDDIIDLLCKLLAYVPDDRITSTEALNHSAFESIKYEIEIDSEFAEMQNFMNDQKSKALMANAASKFQLNKTRPHEHILIPASSESAPVMSPANGERINLTRSIKNNHSRLANQRSTKYPQNISSNQISISKQVLNRDLYNNLSTASTTKKKNPRIYLPTNHLLIIGKPQSRINTTKGAGIYQKNINAKVKPQSVLCQPGSSLPGIHAKRI